MAIQDRLVTWTVYFSPVDYPGAFVARKFFCDMGPHPVPTSEMFVASTLQEVRALLPPGMICFCRSDGDAPSVVETWL